MTDKQSPASRADLKIIANDIAYIRQDVTDMKTTMSTSLVTQDQFANVKTRVSLLEKVVYGFVGLVLTAFAIALLSGVIGRK